jgi:hypothetical protein
MDDITVVDDEKKPFDDLGAQNDEDSQPDPDEHIMLEAGHGRVWLVKVILSPLVTPLRAHKCRSHSFHRSQNF